MQGGEVAPGTRWKRKAEVVSMAEEDVRGEVDIPLSIGHHTARLAHPPVPHWREREMIDFF